MPDYRLKEAYGANVYVRRLAPRASSKILWTPKPGAKEIHEGIVRHVGPGAINPTTGERTPPDVKVGDRVVFTGDGLREVTIDGEPLVAMMSGLIMLVLEPEAGDEPIVDPRVQELKDQAARAAAAQ